MWPLKGKQVETEDEDVEMLSVSSDSSVVCVSHPLVLRVVLLTLLILRSLSLIAVRSGFTLNLRQRRATTVEAST